MDTEKIRQLTIDDLAQNVKIDYVDGDIAFTDHISHASPKPGLFRIDAIRMVACLKGCMRVHIGTKEFVIQANEVLCCGPNVLLSDVVTSADMECKVLALSSRVVRRVINPGCEMRNKIFYVNQNPVLHIGEEGMLVFKQYYDLLFSRMKASDNVYRKDIVFSLVSAILYELLANLNVFSTPADNALIRQGDLLFKRFIELLGGMQIKERSVSYYAEKLFVTSKYLSTVCKQVSGKTAFEFINQLVMEDITALLKYSEKSIKEISEYLDFPNISFFGKYIKTHSGFSPTEYRRQLSQNRT